MSILTQERERISAQLPKRINYLLSSYSITPDEAQERTGIYRGDLKNILEGKFMPSVPQLSAIALLFGVSVDHLISIDGWTGRTE